MTTGPTWDRDTGTRYASLSNELIVAVPHVSAVRAELEELGFSTDNPAPEISKELGLARLELTERGPGPDQDFRDANDPGAFDLDAVLRALRTGFGNRYGGWSPTIGKNRLIGHVSGSGDVSFGHVTGGGEVTFGGSGIPEPIRSPAPWPPRGAGPGQGARVGVADTRLVSQPWMQGGWVARYSDRDLTRGTPTVMAGHATFVTGLVLSQAPGATVEVRRILDDQGIATSWDAAKGILDFAGTGVDVLNLSFACYTDDGQPPLVLATAISRLDPGIVVVAAAGNHAQLKDETKLPPAWPAALDDVVAVGAATTRDGGERADFSPDAPWVDLLAVGVGVKSTFFDGPVNLPDDQNRPYGAASEPQQFHGFAQWSGTSFAAALVTGAIAAGTEPGRVSARASYENIRTVLHDSKPPQNGSAPFLYLELSD
jgi:membrane-anchored mycosin MYCP